MTFSAINETNSPYSARVESPLASRASAQNGNNTAAQNAPTLIEVGNVAVEAPRSFVEVEGAIVEWTLERDSLITATAFDRFYSVSSVVTDSLSDS